MIPAPGPGRDIPGGLLPAGQPFYPSDTPPSVVPQPDGTSGGGPVMIPPGAVDMVPEMIPSMHHQPALLPSIDQPSMLPSTEQPSMLPAYSGPPIMSAEVQQIAPFAPTMLPALISVRPAVAKDDDDVLDYSQANRGFAFYSDDEVVVQRRECESTIIVHGGGGMLPAPRMPVALGPRAEYGTATTVLYNGGTSSTYPGSLYHYGTSTPTPAAAPGYGSRDESGCACDSVGAVFCGVLFVLLMCAAFWLILFVVLPGSGGTVDTRRHAM